MCLEESPPEGYPSHPHPHGAWIWRLSHMEKRQIESQNAKSGHQNETPEWGRGGVEFRHFSNNSTMKPYFKMLLSHGGVCFFSSTYSNVILCSHLLSTCCAGENGVLYSEAQPIKGTKTNRQPSVDDTPFYRQHLCGGQCTHEQSQPQQHTGTVSSLLFFPLKFLLHKVYISNILCGLRL